MAGLGLWLAVGFLLIFAGMAVIVAAVLLSALGQQGQRVEAGGVVMIGPIPIVFGTSWKMATIAIVLAIALMVIAIALMLLTGRAFTPPAPQAHLLNA
ncbi:MAG: TIGR00304 family membrane protein [Acidilobus sp.]